MKNETKTLGTALPEEMARVRALKSTYEALDGGVGRPAAYMMEMSLRAADQAVMSGDVVAMLRCYEDLKGFTG